MGGLQSGLIARSKKVLGHGYLDVRGVDYKQAVAVLDKAGLAFYPEYEIELMAKKGTFLSPVILHGIDFSRGIPAFLAKKDRSGIILGSELGGQLSAYFHSGLQFISPSHLDRLFGDVPRYISEEVSDFYTSELTEIDSVHAWTRATLVQNLIRSRSFNKVRFFEGEDFARAKSLLPDNKFVSWEEQNRSLVWALGLETNVMLFLFISMTFLVALCVVNGFLIFFDKIKVDLMSLWVLGHSKKRVLRLSFAFSQALSLIFCLLGLLAGYGVLSLISSSGLNFMPDFFVERSIPVKITLGGIISSFGVPYLVASLFSYFSFSFFKKENTSFIQNIRKIV